VQVAQQLIQLAARRDAGAAVLAARQQQFAQVQQDVLDHMHAGNAGAMLRKHMKHAATARRDTRAHERVCHICASTLKQCSFWRHTTVLWARR